MPLDYERMMGFPPIVRRQAYTRRDTILYALGVGVGIRATDDPTAWLRFVHEDGLLALPTMAVVLAYPGFWLRDPKYAVDWRRVLHGEQSIELLRPIPPEGTVRSETAIETILDKGADKGAIVYSIRRVYDETAGGLIANVRQASFLRGDGGFGGRADGGTVPHPVPARAPDLVETVATRPEQALIYRLSGDDNPLHAVPEIAAQAGFPKPILHGLSTYGTSGTAIVAALCGGDPARLKRFDARFSSPVFPGETLSVAIWREGPGKAAVQVSLVERDVVVLRHGYVDYDEG
jgi:acyl dehydratase